MRKTHWVTNVITMLIVPSIWLLYVSGWAQEIRYITPEALKEFMGKKDDTFLIVDTQPEAAYKTGHIKGAINFPWAPEIRNPSDLPRDRILVLYCDCGNEEDSIDVAKQLLQKYEYVYVRVLKGGWSQWQNLGYPVEKSGE